MKCPICKGTMKSVHDAIEEDNIAFQAYKCTSCGEELMDMNQLKALAGRYRKLRKAKEITFAKWGNSIAIRIPRSIAAAFGIIEGKQGLIMKEKEGIKILPA